VARTKRLTSSQISALTLLSTGQADFYDLSRVGATGSTSAWLVKAGLATEGLDGHAKVWQITEAGRSVLAAGRVVVV